MIFLFLCDIVTYDKITILVFCQFLAQTPKPLEFPKL